MVQIELTSKEAERLGEVLESYLSDLRMEIADTDDKSFRDGLKDKEAFLGRMLERLGA
jgi:hypothetical protein